MLPPTYDLRVLGEELALQSRLDRYVDRFLEMADGEVGEAFARVPSFAACAATEAGREQEWYRATTRERYLLELLACGVLARQFWPAFVARRDTVLLLPDCLRMHPTECLREETECGFQCRQCHPDCLVGRIAGVAEDHGAAAFFSQRERPAQFQALFKRYPELSVLGIACVWMLANGLRSAEEVRIPAQGVLLGYSACEHWAEQPFPTYTVVAHVEHLLRKKAAARRAAG